MNKDTLIIVMIACVGGLIGAATGIAAIIIMASI